MTLRKSSIDFQALVNNLQSGIFRMTLGERAKCIYANPAFCEMMGFTDKQIIGKLIKQFFADSKLFYDFTNRIDDDGIVWEYEAKLRGKGKLTKWASLSVNVVRETKGRPKFADVVVRDKTEQKLYEKELNESKDLFRTVFNNTAAAITVTDKDEMIVAWNPFAEQLLEMGQEDLFNKPIHELYSPKEWRRIRSFKIRKKGMLSDIETQILKKNGEALDVNISISVLKDIEGNVIGSIGIIRDITSQKQAERKLIESENKIRVILDNSAAGITMIDEEERIISWNKHTEELLKMDRDDLYLRPVKTIYPEEEWRKIRAERIRAIGSKHHLETKVVDKHKNVIDISLSINVLRDSSNKVIGAVGIMQDITEQKKVREALVQARLAAEEASNAKSLFLANMSHEVRTPMNAILGMIDLTLDTHLNGEQRENLKVAKDAADNLLDLLNDILDLSRVEAGKIILENIEFHLPNVVKSVVKGLTVMASKKKQKLSVEIDSDVPHLLMGDPTRVRQVLINLINNAIKFTDEGKHIHVKARVDATLKNRGVVLHFSVKDQGIGIPLDRLDAVFDVFTQADSSTTRKYGGTGLGLAICKRLVEMMNGVIWVESAVGRGSNFQFTAQFKIVDHNAAGWIEDFGHGKSQPAGEKRDLRILLAEDNPVNQKIAQSMLEKQGWTVESVLHGKDVLEKIKTHVFDLILMDAQMPEMDGFETTRRIREMEKDTGEHIPIIALTARAMQEDRNKCLEAGMDGYVAKPIDRKKLYDEIEKIVNKGQSNE